MSAIRPLTRLALRDARHHPWRSVLIVVLIALPVAAFVFGAIGMRTVPDTPDEAIAKVMGSADALVQPPSGPADALAARIRAEGFRVAPLESGEGILRADGRGGVERMTAELADVDLADPLTTGIWELRSGRLPAGAGEVALTTAAAARLGVRPGAEVVLEGNGRRLRVTGIVVGPQFELRQAVGAGLASGVAAADRGVPQLLVGGVEPGDRERLITALGGPSTPVLFATDGDYGDVVPVEARTLLYLLGALGLTAFGLVVASAMAVGARRQLRVLGLLGAAGASPAHRWGSMLLQGAALGAVGVAVGLPGGVVAWGLARDTLEDRWAERIGATSVAPGDLVLVTVIALGVAVGAALLPARVAARTSVLQALGGRRPTPRVRAGMPVAGLVMSGAGLLMLGRGVADPPDSGVPLMVTAGIALAVIGTTVTVPYLVGRLERVAGGLRGTGRLAVRDVARHRGRTGPIVAAVMATGALAVAAGVIATSVDRDGAASSSDPRMVTLTVYGDRDGVAPGCDVVSALAEPLSRVLPGARTACTRTVVVNSSAPLVAVHPDDLGVLGLEAHRADLATGRVLWVRTPAEPVAGPVMVEVRTERGVVRPPVVEVTAEGGFAERASGSAVVDAALVRRWLPNAPVNETRLHYGLPSALSDPQRAALRLLADDLGLRLAGPGGEVPATLLFDDRGGFSVDRLIYWVILPAALVLSVLVVLVGLALVASDGRDERTTLVAVGAGPGHRRRMQAVRAFVLAGMGQALALPVGIACAWVVLRAQDVGMVAPWPMVVALGIVLPLAAAAVGAALIRRDVPAIRRRGT